MILYQDCQLTICGPDPSQVYEVSREPVGTKWCFTCRKHLPHDWVVFDERGVTYYDPWGRYECSGCGGEDVLGFGREWA